MRTFGICGSSLVRAFLKTVHHIKLTQAIPCQQPVTIRILAYA